MESNSRHQCLLYEGSPSQKLPILATIIKRMLDEGYRCLYLNSPPMIAGMRSTVAALDIDFASEIAETHLVLSSGPVSSEEGFNSELMLNQLEDYLNKAINDGNKRLWASGDMTWEFGPGKDFSKLLDYELNETLNRINPHYLKASWPVDLNTRLKLDEMITALCGI